MARRPPRPPLFPYTTLFRSAEAAVVRARATGADVRLLEDDGTIPFGHGEFDLVWCSEVLEHIPDVGFALSEDRKSTRLNSSHLVISYAVFCLKKKNNALVNQ